MIVCEAGSEVDYVYFPHSGMFSLLVIMQDGRAIETATVGREGVIGAMAGLSLYQSLVRATVQLPLAASKIAAASFRKTVAASGALHQIDQRFCRWLLQSADRAAGDTVTLTQELLAEMLGVRRTSVTEVAGRMQDQGIITYARGVITIVDRPGLEKLSCECYQTLLEHEATLTN
jgi:CRP-like cAMP-binding protein